MPDGLCHEPLLNYFVSACAHVHDSVFRRGPLPHLRRDVDEHVAEHSGTVVTLDMNGLERSCVRTRTDDSASLRASRAGLPPPCCVPRRRLFHCRNPTTFAKWATSWSLASGLLKVRRRRGLATHI